MRLWTLHPRYLDPQGLVALWRESLLAQKVLQGQTRGYRAHPQLARFRAQADPLAYITAYLQGIRMEALQRGYTFDAARSLVHPCATTPLQATQGQLLHEWQHLLHKLRTRDPARYRAHLRVSSPEAHPLFEIVPGPVAEWERARPGE
jgi:hypothetical protein